jgi:hypothetical protein
MEFGIRCFCPFLPSCFPYGHSGLCQKNPFTPMVGSSVTLALVTLAGCFALTHQVD